MTAGNYVSWFEDDCNLTVRGTFCLAVELFLIRLTPFNISNKSILNIAQSLKEKRK